MSIFNQFTKCKDSVFPDQGQCIIIDADEMEKSRSISFYEEGEDWDDDDDDDGDDDDDD